MTNTVNFHKFISLIKKKEIFMMIGNGTNNQFRYISKIKTLLKNLLEQVPGGSVFLYFGDLPNKKKSQMLDTYFNYFMNYAQTSLFI